MTPTELALAAFTSFTVYMFFYTKVIDFGTYFYESVFPRVSSLLQACSPYKLVYIVSEQIAILTNSSLVFI